MHKLEKAKIDIKKLKKLKEFWASSLDSEGKKALRDYLKPVIERTREVIDESPEEERQARKPYFEQAQKELNVVLSQGEGWFGDGLNRLISWVQ